MEGGSGQFVYSIRDRGTRDNSHGDDDTLSTEGKKEVRAKISTKDAVYICIGRGISALTVLP